jgi:hypothetical protein
MASEARKNSREYQKHLAKLNEIALAAINKIADQPDKAVETYELSEAKWKAYVRINNQSSKSGIQLYESAFETKINAYAKELKLRKKVRQAKRANSKGILNDIWSWLKKIR